MRWLPRFSKPAYSHRHSGGGADVLEKPKLGTEHPEEPKTIYDDPAYQLNVKLGKISECDRKISQTLQHFRSAADPLSLSADPETRPDSDLLAHIKLPKNIEKLAIDTNTPRELFAGVIQFLDVTVNDSDEVRGNRFRRNHSEAFETLCKELCERHSYARGAYELRQQNPDNDAMQRTQEQHQSVIEGMHEFCAQAGSDRDLGGMIVDWLDSANAGWEDMAINDAQGPFTQPVAKGVTYEMRYPC